MKLDTGHYISINIQKDTYIFLLELFFYALCPSVSNCKVFYQETRFIESVSSIVLKKKIFDCVLEFLGAAWYILIVSDPGILYKGL